jgi:MYXO-CTERM domain-containing protein
VRQREEPDWEEDMRVTWKGLLALGMIWVIGCGGRESQSGFEPVRRYIDETPPTDLSTPDRVAAVLAESNPEWVMFFGTVWPALVDTSDPSCPRFVDQSDAEAEMVDWRIEGGCTAVNELGLMTRYEGRIVARGDAHGTVIRYEDFETVATDDCDGTPVEASLTAVGEVHVPFALPLLQEAPGSPQDREPPMDEYGEPSGRYVVAILFESTEPDQTCTPVTYGFAYDVRMSYRDEEQDGASRDVMDMKGRVARRSSAGVTDDSGPLGSWELSARGYTTASDVCESEPLAGALTVKAGGHEATVRPDGATRCAALDEPPCAPWSYDDQEQAEQICNYTGCSAGPDAPPPWIALAILLAGLLWQHRHSRRRTRC